MTKDQIKQFWLEFKIPFQEEDPSVNFVNPTDLSKALIKARNWAGVIAESLAEEEESIAKLKSEHNRLVLKLREMDLKVLSRISQEIERIPAWANKNRDTERTYIDLNANYDESQILDKINSELLLVDAEILRAESAQNRLESMRKTLEKSTDWIIQYLNWHKFDLRISST